MGVVCGWESRAAAPREPAEPPPSRRRAPSPRLGWPVRGNWSRRRRRGPPSVPRSSRICRRPGTTNGGSPVRWWRARWRWVWRRVAVAQYDNRRFRRGGTRRMARTPIVVRC